MRRLLGLTATLCVLFAAPFVPDGIEQSPLGSAAALAQATTCVGDCPPEDGRVVINELVIGVAIALERQSLAECPSFDANGDGLVAVAELITAVNNAQLGCAERDTATATVREVTPTRTQSAGTAATTATATPVASATPTVTATRAVGPTISYFGVTSADDTPQDPTDVDPGGIPIYRRLFGTGFSLVVEAQPGDSLRAAGRSVYTPGGVPDLLIQANRPLGNGSTAVCDDQPPAWGGVPGIDPPQIENPETITDALNDLGCRFRDGQGVPTARSCIDGCVRLPDGESRCYSGSGGGTVQFCGQITGPLAFPDGDTLVTVRVRDITGNLGPPAQLILRVQP